MLYGCAGVLTECSGGWCEATSKFEKGERVWATHAHCACRQRALRRASYFLVKMDTAAVSLRHAV